MRKYQGWCTFGGRRHAFYGFNQTGLSFTKKKAAWYSGLFCDHETRQSILMDGSQVLVGGAGLIAALDPASGKPQWTLNADVRFENRAAMNDRLVMVGDFVVDRDTGRLIGDISEMPGMSRSRGYCDVYLLGDGFFRQIKSDEQGDICAFISPDGEVKKISFSHYGAIAFDPERELMFGYSERKPAHLSRVDIESGEILWSYDPPRTISGYPYISSFSAIGEKYLYIAIYNDSLLAVNLETGLPAWISGEQTQTKWDRPILAVTPSQILVSERSAVITDFCKQPGDPWQKYMACFDAETGEPRWKVAMQDGCRHMCILSDWIFGTQHKHPVAWSIHTGEVVWEGEGFIDSAYVLAHGNRVIYETVASELVCFEF